MALSGEGTIALLWELQSEGDMVLSFRASTWWKTPLMYPHGTQEVPSKPYSVNPGFSQIPADFQAQQSLSGHHPVQLHVIRSWLELLTHTWPIFNSPRLAQGSPLTKAKVGGIRHRDFATPHPLPLLAIPAPIAGWRLTGTILSCPFLGRPWTHIIPGCSHNPRR